MILPAFVTLIVLYFVVTSQIDARKNAEKDSLAGATPNGNKTTTTSGAPAVSELAKIRARRIDIIIGGADPYTSLSEWVSSMDSSGKWPDVDYTTGCDARRANWPAQIHWTRLRTIASAWHGGRPGADEHVKNQQTRSVIARGMKFWFDRDFTNNACLDFGGMDTCPCSKSDTSFWNTNWFSNIIYVPKPLLETCVLLEDTLSKAEIAKCQNFATRSFNIFERLLRGTNPMTGANALDIAQLAADQALLTSNSTRLGEAYNKARAELQLMNTTRADGIRSDGSFMQHEGVLYNGNYGKDFIKTVVSIEIVTAGTSFLPKPEARQAFETLFDASQWMVYTHTASNTPRWVIPVIGRFLVFPVADEQASANLGVNLTQIGELGGLWSSKPLTDFSMKLTNDVKNVNAGTLVGNRMFPTSDFMIHRGANYVTALKMYSSRTVRGECLNDQNPWGAHLSDGALFTHISGSEYEDIAATWDWDLIPGITTDYRGTNLTCDGVHDGGVEAFVGGASDGRIGVAAMQFTKPQSSGSFRFRKAWFFLEDDVQHVLVSGIQRTRGDEPVYSVFDQRRYAGSIMVDDAQVAFPATQTNVARSSLWHGDVGYSFPNLRAADMGLSIRAGPRTGTWSAIGSSTQPPAQADVFAAWIQHTNLGAPLSYTVFPGVTFDQFRTKRGSVRVRTIGNDDEFSAVYHENRNVASFIFWGGEGGEAKFTPISGGEITLSANANVAVIFRVAEREVTVSDPSQTVRSVRVVVTQGSSTSTLTFDLPTGGMVGWSVTKKL